MDTIPDMVFHKDNEELFGYRLANLGDVNGDSTDDIVFCPKEDRSPIKNLVWQLIRLLQQSHRGFQFHDKSKSHVILVCHIEA